MASSNFSVAAIRRSLMVRNTPCGVVKPTTVDGDQHVPGEAEVREVEDGATVPGVAEHLQLSLHDLQVALEQRERVSLHWRRWETWRRVRVEPRQTVWG